MVLRVYFHSDDEDHDFVHARARQQLLYSVAHNRTCLSIKKKTALVYVTVLALDFYANKQIYR